MSIDEYSSEVQRELLELSPSDIKRIPHRLPLLDLADAYELGMEPRAAARAIAGLDRMGCQELITISKEKQDALRRGSNPRKGSELPADL